MIPNTIKHQVEKALGKVIDSDRTVSGGSINQAAKIIFSDGQECFLKWNSNADPDMFAKEERGLKILESADTPLRVPSVFATGKTKDGTGFLVQEFISEGRSQPNSADAFGKALAELHRHHEKKFGLDHNNYIGRLPQSNRWHNAWVEFFIEERMKPQLKIATDARKLNPATVSRFESMYKELPAIFPDEPPSLLHGDLWGGNYFFDEKGKATIYDPAVYYGHREIELAFTHLFGGFSGRFYHAYEAVYPLKPGFSQRKDIYNLYPLLVHTNLFGGSYARQVEGIVNRF
ncbi:MAG: fructosamine kinase family protein [Balneolaceae bacterium]|jgi:fructosamine-3-kinase